MSIVTLPARAWTRLRKDWHRWRFGQVARKARQLPPVPRGNLPFVLLSMVHTRDVDAYLVAVHSFTRQVPPQRVVVVCDPSITDEDRGVLKAAVPHIELVNAVDFQRPDLPKGGCWERLQAMVHYAESAYVVQLDADTVTAGPLPEVRRCITGGVDFTLGEAPEQTRVSLETARDQSAPWQHPGVHIQGLAEYRMHEIALPGRWYVRGCAGFFGLAPRPGLLQDVCAFSAAMQQLVGTRWNEWGTEQVTANYLAAQGARFEVLPWPAYATPGTDAPAPKFSHFIGSIRFVSSAYRRAAAATVKAPGATARAHTPQAGA